MLTVYDAYDLQCAINRDNVDFNVERGQLLANYDEHAIRLFTKDALHTSALW